MTEQTLREGIKWAKVSGSKGKWTAALGWASNFNASKVVRTPTKTMALEYAKGWVADQ